MEDSKGRDGDQKNICNVESRWRGISHIDIFLFNGTWVDLIRDAPNLWKQNATKDSLLKLSKKYNAPYVLTYVDHDLDLRVVYKGKYFSIYNLKNTDEKSEK